MRKRGVWVEPLSSYPVQFAYSGNPQGASEWTTCTAGAPCWYLEERWTGVNALPVIVHHPALSGVNGQVGQEFCYGLMDYVNNHDATGDSQFYVDVEAGRIDTGGSSQGYCGPVMPGNVYLERADIGRFIFSRHP